MLLLKLTEQRKEWQLLKDFLDEICSPNRYHFLQSSNSRRLNCNHIKENWLLSPQRSTFQSLMTSIHGDFHRNSICKFDEELSTRKKAQYYARTSKDIYLELELGRFALHKLNSSFRV